MKNNLSEEELSRVRAAQSAYRKERRKTNPPTDEERAKKAAYARDWRKKNPEKTKQYNENYWLKKIRETEGQSK